MKATPSLATARQPRLSVWMAPSIGSAGPTFPPTRVSPACWGREENGRWLLGPAEEVEKTTRKYREHTLVLETTFETADFAVMLIDFMPIRGTNSDIVRIVKGIRGSAAMRMELSLRFDYGATVPWVTRRRAEFTRSPVPTWWCFGPRRRSPAKI